jgi:Heparinase II/III-like protein/Heparinase II/III N-terminus
MRDSTWNRRIGRLASMDRHEVLDRARQFLTARLDLVRYRIGQGFAGTPQAALTAPAGRFFFTPADVPSLCAVLKQVFPKEADDIVSEAEKICQHRFDLLGYENLDYGPEIDWHLDVVHGKRGPRKPWFKVQYLDFEEVGDSKITWELNRHQHFVTLAKAHWLTGDDRFVCEVFAQWAQWHRENPYPIGMNWASSLEVGYRSLSWIWTFFLLQESPLFTTELRQQWHDALGLSGRHIETYLSTYFSPNTHLLGEALALLFIGTLFPALQSSAHWRRRGWDILQREAAIQVREDGFYFEQSTYYHVYALDIFLHARILAGLNGVEISSGFDQIVQRMLNALCLLGRAGVPASFGDDDGGRLFDPRRNRVEHMLDPLATGAALYQRGDLKFVAGGPREETLWLLGVKGLAQFDSLPSAEPSAGSTALLDSGIYLMANEKSRQQLLIDAGPLGAGSGGHGHADALSVCLVQDGRGLLIDPGTFEYVGNSGERARLRGTGAHNTMRVDGVDQAEGAGPFSWQNFPRVTVERWITGQQFDLFQGSHDGYSRLPSPVIHRRWVFHRKGEFWMVRDLAEGRGSHQLDIAWHLGPALSPDPSKRCQFTYPQGDLALLAAEDKCWSHSAREDYWSPAYGRREKASVSNFSARVELPVDFSAVLIAGENLPVDLGRVARIAEFIPGGVCGYRYLNPRQEHDFFFAYPPKPWVLGGWASDAEFLYWSFDREKEQHTLILCNGTYADAGGRRVLTCSQRVRYAEILSSAAKVEVFSSELDHVVLEHPLDRAWAEAESVDRSNDPKGMGV